MFFNTVKYLVLILELLSTEKKYFSPWQTVPSFVGTDFEQLFYHDLLSKLTFIAESDGAFSEV